MTISRKLGLLLAGVFALFVGLAVALLSELHVVASRYDALLSGPVRDSDAARIAQVDFKKQVQEWKDILLRGHDASDLRKYTAQFHEKEGAVREEVGALAGATDDDIARELLTRFLEAHRTLGERYAKALELYTSGGFDFKAADTSVRGQDRPPTEIFDRVVNRFEERVRLAVAAENAAVTRTEQIALGVAGSLLLLLGAFGYIVVGSILQRLGRLKAVADRLARADLQGLAIDISGRDEIGEFGQSMRGVLAAVEELSILAAKNSPAE